MDRIGKYEILDKIGSGGFAVVYKGFDPFIKRTVAIKVCYSRDTETRERFKREAQIAGLLVHRNITTIYDYGNHEQTPFLVEEYLPGEDLAHQLRRKEPETLAEKLDFLVQIASGLGYAHSKGVIHRDIKPSNVRVLENGRIKIMDFGTAKLAHVESNLTQTGMTLGTVAYLSPERLLGQPSGINSDIFSLGVLAYEMLSFRRPFTGRNIPSLIDQVLNASPVPLGQSWPDCPPDLEALVHRCLDKDPSRRYETCEPIKLELERLLLEHGGGTTSGESSTTNIPQVSLQLSGLLERAKQLYERGKYARAEVLLDEVLEIDPANAEARQYVQACRAAAERSSGTDESEEITTLTTTTAAQTSFTSTVETEDARRARKISEAVSSITRYLDTREVLKAAEALRFATGLLGDFEGATALRQRISSGLEKEIFEVKSQALRQARAIVGEMETLRRKNLLPVELAETFVDWVSELDPDDLAARHILSAVQRDSRARATSDDDRKKQEAVASIEKLLDEGDPAMAEQALKFAIRLFGEFEQVEHLQNRISQARQDQG